MNIKKGSNKFTFWKVVNALFVECKKRPLGITFQKLQLLESYYTMKR